MQDNALPEDELEVAKNAAIGCTYQANRLIKIAKRDPILVGGNQRHQQWFLPAALEDYCKTLNDRRGTVERVQTYLRRFSHTFARYGELVYPTAHELAWNFARGVWSVARMVCDEALVSVTGKLPSRDGYALDSALLWEHRQIIRDRLGDQNLINAGEVEAMIRLEHARAVATLEPIVKPSTKPDVAHSDDFTSVRWHGTTYEFNKTQAHCISLLWPEWEKGKCGLSEKTIGKAISSQNDNFRLVHTFRKHPAWGTVIVQAGKGCYRLEAPG